MLHFDLHVVRVLPISFPTISFNLNSCYRVSKAVSSHPSHSHKFFYLILSKVYTRVAVRRFSHCRGQPIVSLPICMFQVTQSLCFQLDCQIPTFPSGVIIPLIFELCLHIVILEEVDSGIMLPTSLLTLGQPVSIVLLLVVLFLLVLCNPLVSIQVQKPIE